jgi:aryl-alcohol dehydrogenase-like predicted oxidoreductase
MTAVTAWIDATVTDRQTTPHPQNATLALPILRRWRPSRWRRLWRRRSVQNAYNLLSRHSLELGLVETCAPKNGNVGIIAHTPLGGGALTAKYLDQTLLDMDKDAR